MDQRMKPALPSEEFRRLVATLGDGASPSSPTSVDFVFQDEVPARLTLHPNGHDVVVDAFAYDATGLLGRLHGAVMDVLLRLNAVGLRGRFFATAIDPRGFVAVTSRTPMADLDGRGLLELLEYVSSQARRVRTVIDALVPPEATPDYSLLQE
jgi:hypothetical protein